MHPDQQTELTRYCEAYSSPEANWLGELVRFTWLNTTNPRQLSGHLQGRFLSFLSKLLLPGCIIEIGTFTGYATLCMAEGLSENGILHSVEADPETAYKARKAIDNSVFANKIKIYESKAEDFLKGFGDKADLIFIDADKQSYGNYLELSLPLLKPRGLIIFDNTLWSQKVLDTAERLNDPDTRNMHNFNSKLVEMQELEVLLLPLRDGLTLVRRKSAAQFV